MSRERHRAAPPSRPPLEGAPAAWRSAGGIPTREARERWKKRTSRPVGRGGFTMSTCEQAVRSSALGRGPALRSYPWHRHLRQFACGNQYSCTRGSVDLPVAHRAVEAGAGEEEPHRHERAGKVQRCVGHGSKAGKNSSSTRRRRRTSPYAPKVQDAGNHLHARARTVCAWNGIRTRSATTRLEGTPSACFHPTRTNGA
jgi:hypothetical protein